MYARTLRVATLVVVVLTLVSCTHFARKMPSEMRAMRGFLSQDNPDQCRTYIYNFERQTPRLYSDNQLDSILDLVDFMKTQCGPSTDIEVTRLLVTTRKGDFADSLIGSSTIPQMLWYRSDQEGILRWNRMRYLFGGDEPSDNSHENYNEFRSLLAGSIAGDSLYPREARLLGSFYSGKFDSALIRLQSEELRGTAMQRAYSNFVGDVKESFPTRANMAIMVGSWRPNDRLSLVGNHPELGFEFGAEGRRWRVDGLISYRFMSSKNRFTVDSLGHQIETDKFNDWYLGGEFGLKIFENSTLSTDVFGSLGYDGIATVAKAGDKGERVVADALSFGIGVRQRIFLSREAGWYIGGSARYNVLNYSNRGGTDLSGQAVTISVMTGWSFHETLYQFLKKLKYKGSWRP
ncbi:MAG: hypothetical protein WAU88_10695 [Candidatus Zixiibacteriota bacterium]